MNKGLQSLKTGSVFMILAASIGDTESQISVTEDSNLNHVTNVPNISHARLLKATKVFYCGCNRMQYF